VNTPSCQLLETGHRSIFVNYDKSIAECGTGFTGTGSGCMNNGVETKATGAGCAPACAAAGAPGLVPSLNDWQVSYSCVPNE
jgi:hypothetical protein